MKIFALIILIYIFPLPILDCLAHLGRKWWRKSSKTTILLVITFYIFVFFLSFLFQDFIFKIKFSPTPLIRILGLIPLLLAIILEILSLAKLGFARLIFLPEIFPQNYYQKLIKTGIYKFIRHPRYLIYFILWPLSMILLTGYLIFFFFSLMAVTLLLFFLIPVEEKELIERFGEEYGEYKKTSSALLPKIF